MPQVLASRVSCFVSATTHGLPHLSRRSALTSRSVLLSSMASELSCRSCVTMFILNRFNLKRLIVHSGILRVRSALEPSQRHITVERWESCWYTTSQMNGHSIVSLGVCLLRRRPNDQTCRHPNVAQQY